MNTHNRLRYFLTNTIFLLQVIYRYVRMIFIVKCVTITRFSLFIQRFDEKHDFYCSLIPLNCTLYSTVQYRYCIFSLFCHLSRIKLKVRILYFHTYERQKVQCSVQYTLLLLYLMLGVSYCATSSIKLYRIYVCYTKIMLYHVYSVRYCPWLHVTVVGRRLPTDTGVCLYIT